MELQRRGTREGVRGFFPDVSWQLWVLSMMMLIFPTLVMLEGNPTPKPWPPQFHALLYQNSTGKLAIVDLWYDWPGGRNLNLIQHQLGKRIHDVEWTNGTSFYFDLEHQTCLTMTFPVGILHPDWLANATYVGEQEIEGFKCNVWEKLDFITYYEDIDTKRPVSWVFFTGQTLHVMAFEEGNILEDQQWQAPSSCFEKALDLPQNHALSSHMGLPNGISQQSLQSLRELYDTEDVPHK
ncbi:unnamed protein product [Sphagnum compactum]